MTKSHLTPHLPGYSDAVEIARGGQARILRAYNERLTRFEAIKIYVPATDDPLSADHARRRFDAEARIAGAFRNQHIIVVHRSEVHDGVPCLFMEYIDGPSLRTVLNDGKTKLSLLQIISILSGVADALDQLAGSPTPVIHRDVKPDNILLEYDADDGFGRAVLADFGVAQRATSSDAVSNSAGTPSYVAPEQLLGAPLTSRSDQYALACTAYELFSGGPPRRATSVEDRLRQIATGAVGSVRSLAGVDRRLRRADRVFARALAVNPAQRYPTATAFVDDLVLALRLTRPGVRARSVAAARRHPRRSAAVAVASALVLAASSVVAYQSLSDLRETVYPMLARPGLYAPCPGLQNLGFSPDPRFTPDAYGYNTSDTLHVLGEFGSFEIVEPGADRRDVNGRLILPETFNLNVSSILESATITSASTTDKYNQGLPLKTSCRYLQNLESPPDGAVVTVFSAADTSQASQLDRDSDLAERLMLDPSVTQVVGLDGDHKTTFTTWSATRPPYDTCAARLTGHDGADTSPLVVLHQARELVPAACDKLSDLVGDQLTSAWKTMSPDQRREHVGTSTDPERLSDAQVWQSVREQTQPCGNHVAVGLERRGAVVSTTYGEGCWFQTGRGQRVALFRTVESLAPSAIFGQLESLTIAGHSVDGVSVSTLTITPESDTEVVPVVWIENRPAGDVLSGTEKRQGSYILNSMVVQAIGSQAVR